MTARKKLTALLAAGVIVTGGLAATNTVFAARISSADQARQKALQKVPNAVVTDVGSDRENGQQVYEVELVKGSKKYDMTLRASDGKLLEYKWEKTTVNPNRSRSLIGTEKCKKLALNKVKNATVTSVSQKTDDGIDIYKVKLTAGNKRYTLEYHARTGALLEYQWKAAKTSSADSQNGDIGLEKAKQIALKEVPGGKISKAEYDVDDGVAVYGVEVIKGNYEYEFKIEAGSGTILEREKDFID